MNLSELIYKADKTGVFWAALDIDAWEVVCDVHARVDGGIKYAIWREERRDFPKRPEDMQRHLLTMAQMHGRFSRRPYELGQGCDGSINVCVMHLFVLFCQDKGIDPAKTIYDIYKNDEQEYSVKPREILLASTAQGGVVAPEKWDDKAIGGLIESLTAINHHELSGWVVENYHPNYWLPKLCP
jgi:hypothetical protein